MKMKNMTKKISIAMTTYNGSQYIVELLDSLRQQTRPVQEVIIADDGSTDDTVSIVEDYIKKYSLKGWNIYTNDKNLGWKRNFKEVISKTTGDYVLLADQDDVWLTNKVEKLVKCLEETNGWLAVSDFQAVGEKRYTEKAYMPDLNYVKDTYQVKFTNQFYEILRPGCVMAFTKELKKIFLSLWNDGFAHDALLWDIAMAAQKIFYVNQPTIYFRRTGKNASTKMAHDVSEKINNIKLMIKVDEWALNMLQLNTESKKTITDHLKWCKYRKDLIENKKIINWFNLFRYNRFYVNNKKFLGDLYYCFKSENTRREL